MREGIQLSSKTLEFLVDQLVDTLSGKGKDSPQRIWIEDVTEITINFYSNLRNSETIRVAPK